MKIVMNTLEKIDGIEIYPIISLLIFFSFFLLVGYLVIKTDKKHIEEMSRLPLDGHSDFHFDSNNNLNN
ncbi:MAG: CcoQ/FixQ family Cbb3-type cytochrome c oxidase assembly chaperone [Chlorobi bacterium]|nr:CcoQ/FixQ family Cbb3-type cytochrome c oxidase assembly chaperone [Chlorobiota bacterium]